jgi:hypothetical protein
MCRLVRGYGDSEEFDSVVDVGNICFFFVQRLVAYIEERGEDGEENLQ